MNMRIVDHTAAALNEIRNRIRNSPEYKATRETVVQHVARRVKGKSVAEMRAMGGFTTIITNVVSWFADASNKGTTMIPWTHQNELTHDLQNIRNDAVRLNNPKP